MRIVTLTSGNQVRVGEANSMNLLVANLEAIKAQGAKIYRTYCSVGEHFTFVTTQRDIHLYFGLMSEEAQMALCLIIKAESAHGSPGEILLKGPFPGRPLHVLISGNVFNFSLANMGAGHH
jgi:hypothetical protein